jgi:pimeloyl-ACP methyl ester carboxylesterase
MTDRYIDIAGHSTWVYDSGEGEPTVVLLHGGLSNSDELLNTIGGPIGERHRVVAFDRRGHGRTADTDAPFHYDDMATETIAVLDLVIGGPAVLVGWSDGGIIALLVSMRRPDLVSRQIVIGTNYHVDGLRPLELDPASPLGAMIATAYAERSPDGKDHFEVVLAKAVALFRAEPTLTVDDLATISAPTLVLVGDDDLVELDHTASLYEALAAGRLAIVPGTSHAVPLEAPSEVARLVLDFIVADDPPRTLMPSRRQG